MLFTWLFIINILKLKYTNLNKGVEYMIQKIVSALMITVFSSFLLVLNNQDSSNIHNEYMNGPLPFGVEDDVYIHYDSNGGSSVLSILIEEGLLFESTPSDGRGRIVLFADLDNDGVDEIIYGREAFSEDIMILK